MFAAAHVDHVFPVRADRQTGELLSVVEHVARQLSRLVLRPFGDPDVALPFLIQRVGDARSARRGDELVGEWKTLDLIDRESAAGRLSLRDAGDCDP
jgi:hypothetical protein